MLLLNSKQKTICILKQCIKLLNDPMYFGSRYICFIMFHNIFHNNYNKDIILSDNNDIDNFNMHYYKQIYNHEPIEEIYGYFGKSQDVNNIKLRIQFLKQIIKQINKQYKNNKS